MSAEANDGSYAVLSMTGFGIARGHLAEGEDAPEVEVMLRSVNHRYLKLSMRLPDSLQSFERAIEERLRKRIVRGSLQCTIRLRRPGSLQAVHIDEARMATLGQRLSTLATQLGLEPPSIDALLALPGVIASDAADAEGRDETAMREALLRVVDAAVEPMLQMRAEEGAAMAADIAARCEHVRGLADRAAARSPEVVKEVQKRLTERLGELLAGQNVPVDPEQIAREVAQFADRSDISEEVTRLRHHCQSMQEHLRVHGEAGRRLDFIAQEMLREANTIGSKANDAEIASQVVEMKAEVEKIKEQVQNLE